MTDPVIFWKESARVWPGHPGVARTYLVMSLPKKGYFNKINEAIAYAAPYERIEIGQGCYFENIVLNKPLEIVSEGGGDRAELVSHGVTLTIDCEDCYLDGLHIKTSDPEQYAIAVHSGKGYIQNCNFASISVSGHAAPHIVKNTISGSLTHGIYLSSRAEGTYRDNTVTDHAWYCIWVESGGAADFESNFLQHGKHGLVMVTSTTPDHGDRVKPNFYHNSFMDVVQEVVGFRKGLRGTERSNTKVREVGETTSFAFGSGEERSTVDPQQEVLDLRNLDAYKDRCAIEVHSRCCPVFEGNSLCGCVSNGFHLVQCGGELLNNRITRNAGIGVIITKRASTSILRNTIAENLHGGIDITSYAGGQIEENMLQSNGPFGIRCSSKSTKLRFIRNVIQNHQKVGMRFKDGGVGHCEGNDIRHNALAGVICETLGNPTLTSNLLHFCGCGLVVTNFGKGTFEDNEICDNELEGVKVASNSNPRLLRNTISLCPVGILVTQRGRGEYIENNVRDCGKTQVRVSNLSNPRFIDNNISAGKDEGIVFDSKARGYFEGNTIMGHINPNVMVLEHADPYFYKNHIAQSLSEGVVIDSNGKGTFILNFVERNHCGGVRVNQGAQPTLRKNVVRRCGDFGIHLRPEASGTFEKNIVRDNGVGLVIEGAAKAQHEMMTPALDPVAMPDMYTHQQSLAAVTPTPTARRARPRPLGALASLPDVDPAATGSSRQQRSPRSGYRKRNPVVRSPVTPHLPPPTLPTPPGNAVSCIQGVSPLLPTMTMNMRPDTSAFRPRPAARQTSKQPAVRGLLYEAITNLGLHDAEGMYECPSIFDDEGQGPAPLTARPPATHSPEGFRRRERKARSKSPGRTVHTQPVERERPGGLARDGGPASKSGRWGKAAAADGGSGGDGFKAPRRIPGRPMTPSATGLPSPRMRAQEGEAMPGAAVLKEASQPPPQLTRNIIHSSRSTGVVVYGATYPALTKNIVYNNKGAGVEIKGLTLPSGGGYASPSPTFLANEISDNGGGGVVIRLGGCGVFAQNLIHTNQPFGVEIASAAAHPFLAANIIEGSAKGLVLRDGCGGAAHGNIFRELAENGVEITGSCTTALSHNVITQCPAGICFKGTSSCTVEDNLFIENAKAGVVVEDGATLKSPICGNLFVNNPVGLSADGCGTFSQNMFLANSINVACGGSGRPVVRENIIYKAADVGVLVASGADGRATIADNSIDGNHRGIVVGKQSSPQITGNTVKDGTIGLETSDDANGTVLCNTFCNNDINVLLNGGHQVHINSNLIRDSRLAVVSKPRSRGVMEENIIRNNRVGVVVNGGNANLTKNYIFEQDGPGVLIGYPDIVDRDVERQLNGPRAASTERARKGMNTSQGQHGSEQELNEYLFSDSDEEEMRAPSPRPENDRPPVKRPTSGKNENEWGMLPYRRMSDNSAASGSFRGRPAFSIPGDDSRPNSRDQASFTLAERPDSKEAARPRRPNFKDLAEDAESPRRGSNPPAPGGRKQSHPGGIPAAARRGSRGSVSMAAGVPLQRLSMVSKQFQAKRDSRAGLITSDDNSNDGEPVALAPRRNSRRRSSLAMPAPDAHDGDMSCASSRRRSTASTSANFNPVALSGDMIYSDEFQRPPADPQDEYEALDDADAMVAFTSNMIFDNAIGIKALRGPLVLFNGNTIKTNLTFGVKVRQGRGIFEANTITHQKTHAVFSTGAHATPKFLQNHIKSNSGFGVLMMNNSKGEFIQNRITANQQGVCVSRGADPLFERNVIYGHPTCAVLVERGGRGTFRENDLSTPTADHDEAPSTKKNISVETLHMYLVVGEGSHPTITESHVHSAKIQGIYVRNGAGGVIENNKIYGNGGSGIEVSEGACPIIAKNKIYENGTQGIHVNLHSGGEIRENIISRNATGGIHMRGGSHCEVVDNVLEDEEHGGLWVTSSSGAVEGNRVIGCGTFGICFVGPATKSECTRNSITKNIGVGIKVTEGARPLLSENIVYRNEGVGVEIGADGIPRLMQNLFYESSNVALRLVKSSGGNIHRNLFAKNTAASVVEVEHVGDALLEENFFFGNTNACVRFGEEAQGKLTGNMCCTSGTGFLFTRNSSPTVSGNVMWKMEDYCVSITEFAAPTISDDDYAGSRNINVNVTSSMNPKISYSYIRNARNAGVYVSPTGVLTLHASTLLANVTAVEVKSGLLKCNACQVRDNTKAGFCFSGDADAAHIQPMSPAEEDLEATPKDAKDVMNEKALASHPTPVGSIAMCDISCNGTGVWIKAGGNPKVRSCRLHRNTKSAILTTADGRGLFRENEIYKNEDGIIDAGAAIFLENNVYDSNKHGVFVHGGQSVYHSNMIYDNQYCSFYVDAGSPWLAKNKIYYAREGGAFRSSNPGTQTVKNNTVFNQQSPVVNNTTSLDRRSLQEKEGKELEKQRIIGLKRGARKAEWITGILADIEHVYKGWIPVDGTPRDFFEVLGVAGGRSGLESIRETIEKVGSKVNTTSVADAAGRQMKIKSQMLSVGSKPHRMSAQGSMSNVMDMLGASDGKVSLPAASPGQNPDDGTARRRRVTTMATAKTRLSRARASMAQPTGEKRKSAARKKTLS